MRVRVLHVIPTLSAGGAERMLAELTVASAGAAESHIVRLVEGDVAFPHGAASMTTLGLARGDPRPAAALALRHAVARIGPDVIQSWMYHCNLLASATLSQRVPIVWSIHNTTLPRSGSKWTTRLVNRLCAPLSRVVPRAIVYCADKARDLHEAIGYARRKGVVIENGVDLRKFRHDAQARARVRNELGIAPEHELVGVIGRYDPQKDLPTAIAAFAAVAAERPQARLALAGAGNNAANSALTALCRERGVSERVLLLDIVADVHNLINALDLLVISSAFGEAMPVVALEAAASLVAIVTSDVGDYSKLDLLPEQIVPAADPRQLAAAIVRRLAARGSHAEDAHLAALRSRVAAAFSVDAMAAKYVALWRDILAR